MNPFIFGSENTKNTAASLPVLKEYAWDFEADTFLYNTDKTPVIVSENDALKVWIYKAVKTERFRYEAYKHGIRNNKAEYGTELERFIGTHANNENSAVLVRRYIEEGLSVNPYIERINGVTVESAAKDTLVLVVDLTSVYGPMTQRIRM